MTARSLDGRTYLEHAFFSPAHPLAFLGLLILAVIVPSGWNTMIAVTCTVVALLADAVLLFIVSSMAGYRRSIDAELAEFARREAVARRAALLAEMSEAHRVELQELESLVDAIRESSAPRGVPARQLLDACGELLAAFVRLAVRHRHGLSCLGSIDRVQIDVEAAKLERSTSGGDSQVRALVERRLALARERSQLWDSRCARLRAIEEQLAIIGERIRLAH